MLVMQMKLEAPLPREDPEAWTRVWRGGHPARSLGVSAGSAEPGGAREVGESGAVPGAEQ